MDEYSLKEDVYVMIRGTLFLKKSMKQYPVLKREYIVQMVQEFYKKADKPVPTEDAINSVLEELVEEKRMGLLSKDESFNIPSIKTKLNSPYLLNF